MMVYPEDLSCKKHVIQHVQTSFCIGLCVRLYNRQRPTEEEKNNSVPIGNALDELKYAGD